MAIVGVGDSHTSTKAELLRAHGCPISVLADIFKVVSRLMRSGTSNSACGPPLDAGSPTGAGPSTEADTESNADPPSDSIVSFG
jgi:hypothetical protein